MRTVRIEVECMPAARSDDRLLDNVLKALDGQDSAAVMGALSRAIGSVYVSMSRTQTTREARIASFERECSIVSNGIEAAVEETGGLSAGRLCAWASMCLLYLEAGIREAVIEADAPPPSRTPVDGLS